MKKKDEKKLTEFRDLKATIVIDGWMGCEIRGRERVFIINVIQRLRSIRFCVSMKNFGQETISSLLRVVHFDEISESAILAGNFRQFEKCIERRVKKKKKRIKSF